MVVTHRLRTKWQVLAFIATLRRMQTFHPGSSTHLSLLNTPESSEERMMTLEGIWSSTLYRESLAYLMLVTLGGHCSQFLVTQKCWCWTRAKLPLGLPLRRYPTRFVFAMFSFYAVKKRETKFIVSGFQKSDFLTRPELCLPAFVCVFPFLGKLLPFTANFQTAKLEVLNWLPSSSLGRDSEKYHP